MKARLIDIFWVFLKIGSLLFGGGWVILPLLEKEAVKKRNWLSTEELYEFFAISQAIPGINVPDVSMFIGYKLRGKLGSLVAGISVLLVPFISIILFLTFLNEVSQNFLIKSALWGIQIGSIVILIVALKTIWKNSIVDRFNMFLFSIVFIVITFTDLSPAWIIFVALLLGVGRGFLIKEYRKE